MSYKFAENIQRSILYLIKSDLRYYQEIADLIKTEYFEFPLHGHIFDSIKNYYEKYRSLPSDDIILEESKANKPPKVLASEYDDEMTLINRLAGSAFENFDYVLTKVEKFAKERALKEALVRSVGLLQEGKFEEVEGLVKNALISTHRNVEIGLDYFDSFEERIAKEHDKEFLVKYKTVFSGLDSELEGGLNPKELAMVVAPAGVGKSLYLANQTIRSLQDGMNVLYISLEMSEDRIAQRLDSIATYLSQETIRDKENAPKLKNRLQTFKETFPTSRLIIKEFPTGSATVNTIRALLSQLRTKKDFSPNIIIVDYLELLRSTRDIQQEYLAQQRIAEELRGIAMEYNLLVFTASQGNRNSRDATIITDAHLADSYGKIRVCDYAISLNQTDEEFDNGQMRVYVMKSRNGRGRFLLPISINYRTLRMDQDGDLMEEHEMPREEGVFFEQV